MENTPQLPFHLKVILRAMVCRQISDIMNITMVEAGEYLNSKDGDLFFTALEKYAAQQLCGNSTPQTAETPPAKI